jgi:hypothetical protein
MVQVRPCFDENNRNRQEREPSTNFRWWDSVTTTSCPDRRDLNHPPTAVGGIWTFCAKSFNFRIARDSRHRDSVELVRGSNECLGDFEAGSPAGQPRWGASQPRKRSVVQISESGIWALCSDPSIRRHAKLILGLLVCYGPHYVRGHVRAFPRAGT